MESNRKTGTERELNIALEAQKKYGLKDFVVPLKADQFPFQAALQSIRQLNFIRFDQSRAAGLTQLLKLLEREGAPKSQTAGPACVSEWYRRSLEPQRQVVVSNETCFSNWFRLYLPKHLRFHRFRGPENQLETVASAFVHPYIIHGSYLVTFSSAKDVDAQLAPQWDTSKSAETFTVAFSQNGERIWRSTPPLPTISSTTLCDRRGKERCVDKVFSPTLWRADCSRIFLRMGNSKRTRPFSPHLAAGGHTASSLDSRVSGRQKETGARMDTGITPYLLRPNWFLLPDLFFATTSSLPTMVKPLGKILSACTKPGVAYAKTGGTVSGGTGCSHSAPRSARETGNSLYPSGIANQSASQWCL